MAGWLVGWWVPVMQYPQLYIPGIRGKSFTFDHFWRWILVALVEAVLATIYPLYALRTATVRRRLNTSSSMTNSRTRGGEEGRVSRRVCLTGGLLVVPCMLLLVVVHVCLYVGGEERHVDVLGGGGRDLHHHHPHRQLQDRHEAAAMERE